MARQDRSAPGLDHRRLRGGRFRAAFAALLPAGFPIRSRFRLPAGGAELPLAFAELGGDAPAPASSRMPATTPT